MTRSTYGFTHGFMKKIELRFLSNVQKTTQPLNNVTSHSQASSTRLPSVIISVQVLPTGMDEPYGSSEVMMRSKARILAVHSQHHCNAKKTAESPSFSV